MDNKDPQYTLAPLSKEEGEVIVGKLKAFLDENSVDMVISPLINKDGTLGAKCEIYKKLELVPKAVPFPMDALKDEGNEGKKA